MAPARRRLASLALIAGAVGIGVAPLFVRWINVHHHVGPTAIAFWRMSLSLPLFVALAALSPRQEPEREGPGRLWLIAAGLFFAADLTLWHWSLLRTSISDSTLLSNLAPVLVAAGAWWWFGQRVSRGFLVALALAIGGAALLTLTSARAGGSHLAGDLVALASAAAYAAYLLCVSRLRRRWSAATIMAWSGASSCAAFALVGWLAGERFLPEHGGWPALAAFALAAQVLGQALVAFSLEAVPPTFASVTLLVQPVLATALAWPLFDEPLGAAQAVGGVVVIAGILLARRAV